MATLSRSAPETVFYGFKEGPDSEDVRILEVVVAGLPIVNTYVPQGYRVDSEKFAFKLEWFRRMRQHFDERLDAQKPTICTGDMNVAPEPIDVYHPDRRVNDVDFHVDARRAYAEVAGWGFVDVFRKLHPERVQYTYWDYFRNALQNNWGGESTASWPHCPLRTFAASLRLTWTYEEPREDPTTR